MSSERDELFQLMLGRTTTKAVERILAAGYRKPRTITNIDEASDLPAYSVVKDAHDDCYLKQEDGWLAFGSTGQFLTPGWFYPMTALWEPEA